MNFFHFVNSALLGVYVDPLTSATHHNNRRLGSLPNAPRGLKLLLSKGSERLITALLDENSPCFLLACVCHIGLQAVRQAFGFIRISVNSLRMTAKAIFLVL